MNLLLLVTLPLLVLVQTHHPVSGQFSSPRSYLRSHHTLSTNLNYVEVSLVLTPSQNSCLLLLSTSPIDPSTDPADWQHLNPKNYTHFDYENMLMGRPQTAWIPHPGSGARLYVYLINFQSKNTPQYQVTVTETSSITHKCDNTKYYESTFYCQSCPSRFTGNYCNIPYKILNQNQLLDLVLQPQGFYLVHMVTTTDATVSVGVSQGGVTFYFQYDQWFGQFAGLVNSVQDGSVPGRLYFVSEGSQQIQLQNGNRYVSVGIYNQANTDSNVWIEFSQSSLSMTLLIILVATGAFLLLSIVLTIYLVYGRQSQERRTVNPEAPSSPAKKTASNLTVPEINLLFPIFKKKQISSEQTSFSNISKADQESAEEQLCSICLCEMGMDCEMRVTYCRHMFHAGCLSQWIQKKPSCPYCRKEYTRKSALEAYRQLVKNVGRKVRGLELVESVLRPMGRENTMETMLVEEIRDGII